jgi:hypothetical protein
MTYRAVFSYVITTASMNGAVIRQLHITTPAKQYPRLQLHLLKRKGTPHFALNVFPATGN